MSLPQAVLRLSNDVLAEMNDDDRLAFAYAHGPALTGFGDDAELVCVWEAESVPPEVHGEAVHLTVARFESLLDQLARGEGWRDPGDEALRVIAAFAEGSLLADDSELGSRARADLTEFPQALADAAREAVELEAEEIAKRLGDAEDPGTSPTPSPAASTAPTWPCSPPPGTFSPAATTAANTSSATCWATRSPKPRRRCGKPRPPPARPGPEPPDRLEDPGPDGHGQLLTDDPEHTFEPGCSLDRAPGKLVRGLVEQIRNAPLAQRIEHLTTDQKVGGSNPSGRANRASESRISGY
ncbi:hypothetical protein GCM10029992_08240 [Glycomyces albus]